jgi:hypothetical protein
MTKRSKKNKIKYFHTKRIWEWLTQSNVVNGILATRRWKPYPSKITRKWFSPSCLTEIKWQLFLTRFETEHSRFEGFCSDPCRWGWAFNQNWFERIHSGIGSWLHDWSVPWTARGQNPGVRRQERSSNPLPEQVFWAEGGKRAWRPSINLSTGWDSAVQQSLLPELLAACKRPPLWAVDFALLLPLL